ncbi:hypothetical protein PGT21_006366 [Puccinia graminis f. sp. tritici]|uniref:Uncharacterized protein n=1 Tax=Puccinia graminis f. sp. tritici TaxID=56615 RepID=A0A5B0PN59_PUCGR|nr:hypothetical protein PGT21_006366 [Puccinia graminis f. sp. tritici]
MLLIVAFKSKIIWIHHSIDWTESSKWTSRHTKIEGINNPYLVILFNFRAPIPKTPRLLPNNDNQRTFIQIHSLKDIGCLTPGIASALERLVDSEADLIRIRDGHIESGYPRGCGYPLTISAETHIRIRQRIPASVGGYPRGYPRIPAL